METPSLELSQQLVYGSKFQMDRHWAQSSTPGRVADVYIASSTFLYKAFFCSATFPMKIYQIFYWQHCKRYTKPSPANPFSAQQHWPESSGLDTLDFLACKINDGNFNIFSVVPHLYLEWKLIKMD